MDIRVVPPGQFGVACLAALTEAVAGRPDITVGLPTGNTPVPLYDQVARAVREGEVGISAWRPFAIDEYGGPKLHPCSNRAFFARYWDIIAGAPAVEQFDPEAADLDREAQRMREEIERAGGLDVAVLGIGMNGHVAFNEPGSRPEDSVRRVELTEASRSSAKPCWGEETPTWGLTLGLRELYGARAVILMANGRAKAEIVAAAIEGPETPQVPASLVRNSPNVVWILDDAAASRLKR